MGIDFRVKQAEFAAYIRNPNQAPLPRDIPKQRMETYRDLFFNNINGFLSSNFPVIRRLLEDSQWLALTQDFYQRHRCNTPYFSQIAEEFLDYLQNERDADDDLPFLIELAHYEWVEMALAIAQENPMFGNETFVKSVMSAHLCLSPLAWPLAYEFPVHLISPDYQPKNPPEQASYLIVYRDPKDEVCFMQTTPLTMRLLELVQQQSGLSGEALLAVVSSEIQNIDPQTLQTFGRQTLEQLAEKGVLIPEPNA